jgi:multidrug resistance protein, MATE family
VRLTCSISRRVLHLSTPIVLQNLFQYSLVVISTAFVGHLGDPLIMSGVVLASSFANVTGSSILMGLADAMDTMCGQVS